MKKLTVVALACALAGSVMAETAGFQLSLTPDIAIQDRDTEIKGVSIGVWNENPGSQWQIGFVNGATGESAGLQGPIFWTIYNYAEDFTGLQWGLVNYASVELTGVQWGAVNVAKAVDGGFQWGVVNYAETANNLFQLGLVNIISDNAWFSDFPGDLAQGMIIVNWSFGE
jgi:hypothetical protein